MKKMFSPPMQRIGGRLELTQGQFLCLLIVLLGSFGDIVTTGVGMTHFGTQEGNPFALALITHMGLWGYFLVKSTLVMATVLFVLRSINRFVTRYPNRIVNQAIAVLTLLVAGGGGVFLLVMTYLNLYVGYLNLNS